MTESASPLAAPEAAPARLSLDATGIMGVIPHRPPFLLVDRILDGEPGRWALGCKAVTMGEPFFAGHFPGQPVMPGVLILEALAQTGAVALLSADEYRGRIALFGGVRSCRFRRQVVPGDTLELRCELTALRGGAGFGHAVATVGGQVACQADISFAIPRA